MASGRNHQNRSKQGSGFKAGSNPEKIGSKEILVVGYRKGSGCKYYNRLSWHRTLKYIGTGRSLRAVGIVH